MARRPTPAPQAPRDPTQEAAQGVPAVPIHAPGKKPGGGKVNQPNRQPNYPA